MAQPSAAAVAQQANILVIAGAGTPELKVAPPAPPRSPASGSRPARTHPLLLLQALETLPEGARVVHVGQTLQDFASLSPEDWASVNVLLNCGVGKNAGTRDHIKVRPPACGSRSAPQAGRAEGALRLPPAGSPGCSTSGCSTSGSGLQHLRLRPQPTPAAAPASAPQAIWPQLSGLRWMHSASAGLEHLLFPELVESDVLLTNAKGVYRWGPEPAVQLAVAWRWPSSCARSPRQRQHTLHLSVSTTTTATTTTAATATTTTTNHRHHHHPHRPQPLARRVHPVRVQLLCQGPAQADGGQAGGQVGPVRRGWLWAPARLPGASCRSC
jgi:hypothetical protein